MKNKNMLFSYLSLFTSVGTIVCCALPALLVFLGLGAAFSGLITLFPQVVWLSEYKAYVFLLSAFLMAVSFFMIYLNRNAPCPLDENEARACRLSRKISIVILSVSLALWILGFFFAYLAVEFL